MALLFLTLASVAVADRASLDISNGNVEMRVPRGSDVTYERSSRDATSLFDLQTRMQEMEEWKANALKVQLAEQNMNASLNTIASAVTSTTDLLTPMTQQINAMQQKLDSIRNSLPALVTNSTGNAKDTMATMLANFDKDMDKALNDMVGSYNATTRTMSQTIASAQTAMTKSVNDGKAAYTSAVNAAVGKATPPNWCFKWGNGIDQYSGSWRQYPGMTCKVASRTGWMKITIEGRIYGHNHGGFRVTGGGQTFGREGTYGFQWMNSEHHGHRWLPFNIVRFVQVKKGSTIDYQLQYRSQHNGRRFHIAGGNYGQQYSGLWWSMEEMPEPMSKP